jgi:hypothetical protein
MKALRSKALLLAMLALPGGFVITPALWLLQRHVARTQASGQPAPRPEVS